LVQANLAAEYLKIGQADKALPLFLKAIELSPNLDFRVKTGLGGAMQALNLYPGRYTTGHEYILPGGTFNSGALNFGNFNQWEAVICNNKALVYEYYGNDSKAWDAYQNAIWIYPSYDLAWYNFGLLAARLQQWEKTREAIDHLKKLNPGMAKSLEMALHH
jgi:tetratricopeptide (TPR) repeat protein